jgi:hypothetical protein
VEHDRRRAHDQTGGTWAALQVAALNLGAIFAAHPAWF